MENTKVPVSHKEGQGEGQGGTQKQELQKQPQQQKGEKGEVETYGGGRERGQQGGWLMADPFAGDLWGNELFPSRFSLLPSRRHRHGRQGQGGVGNLLNTLLDVPASAFPLSLPQFPTELKETDKGYFLSIDCPGINKKDIKVTVDNNVINISGQRHEEKEQDENVSGTVYHTKEISRGSFSRSFQLPQDAEFDKLEANASENGVLKINVPKSQKKSEREIEIK